MRRVVFADELDHPLLDLISEYAVPIGDAAIKVPVMMLAAVAIVAKWKWL